MILINTLIGSTYMKCSVFIATSTDGYIATEDGDVNWLHTAGKQDVDMGDNSDLGFKKYIDSVDCMIMGRKSMEKIASFSLPIEQWPYKNLSIFVLSSTLTEIPSGIHGPTEIYNGDVPTLLEKLSNKGFKHAYIDGGSTITSFLNLGLIDKMCITLAPVILGKGKPLFGTLQKQIKLDTISAIAYPNNFIQTNYTVVYD